MSDAALDPERCANCHASLSGAFCAQCGQKVKPLDPTLRELATDVLHEVTDVDSKLLRSVRYLFTRPGFLSREHAEGRRASYVSPVRLYLVFSVAFFAAASLVVQREQVFSQAEMQEILAEQGSEGATRAAERSEERRVGKEGR